MSGPVYLLATRSGGKLRELRPLFDRHGLQVIDLREAGLEERPEEANIEAFDTFEENARAKAEYFARLSGLPTFADDSGLVIPALAGRPGVRSKRWSGRTDLEGAALDEANNAMLTQALRILPEEVLPNAEYVCAAALSRDGSTIVRTGRTHGVIVSEPVGGDGFGYDPYFRSSELGITFGQADVATKNAISHRGRAFTALLEAM